MSTIPSMDNPSEQALDTDSEKSTEHPHSHELSVDNDRNSIEHALTHFRPIRDRRLERLLGVIPLAIVIVTTIRVFATWYTLNMLDPKALSYLSGGLALIITFLITQELFNHFPQTLLIIWRRKLLKPKRDGASTPELMVRSLDAQFQEFITVSEDQLNSNLSIGFGLLGILFVLYVFVVLDQENMVKLFTNFRSDPFAMSLSWIIRLTFLVGGFIGGLAIWRIVIIARRIRKLGYDFDLNLQIEHPDGCAGLGPVGDLCLVLGLVVSPLLVLSGVWLMYISLSSPAQLALLTPRYQDLVSMLQALVIPLSLLGMVSFFQPSAAVHAAMDRSRLGLLEELDGVGQQIHEISTALRTQADRLSPDQAAQWEKKIDFLQRVYARNSNIPTWPFNYAHMWRLAGAQLVPAIGLISSFIGTARSLLHNSP